MSGIMEVLKQPFILLIPPFLLAKITNLTKALLLLFYTKSRHLVPGVLGLLAAAALKRQDSLSLLSQHEAKLAVLQWTRCRSLHPTWKGAYNEQKACFLELFRSF